MGKRRLLLLGAGVALLIGLWQLPLLAPVVPSRYIALLPPALQRLAVRPQPDILPTAAVPADISALLRPAPAVPAATPPRAETLTPAPAETLAPAATPTMTETPLPAATSTATLIPRPRTARLEGITHHFQTWNNCGPATLAMGLSYFGIHRTQQQTAAILKPDPEDRNVSPYEMAAYVNEYTTEVAAFDRANGDLQLLRELLARGWPVIVELGINPPGEYRWMGWYGHYLLLVAYDDDAEQFWVYDSWFGTSEVPGENATSDGRAVAYLELDRMWREFNRNYIVLYPPEEAAQVTAIVGPDMDDSVMWRRALPLAQAEVTAEPGDAFLWFNLGTVYNGLEDYEKAAAAFDQARATGLPWRMLWYQFGPYEAYYQTGRYEDVIILANAALDGRPYFEESYYYRGRALAAMGDLIGARRDFSRAVAFNPNFMPAVEALNDISARD
jgi:tetratricopeptide (TPR) repeat protein